MVRRLVRKYTVYIALFLTRLQSALGLQGGKKQQINNTNKTNKNNTGIIKHQGLKLSYKMENGKSVMIRPSNI